MEAGEQCSHTTTFPVDLEVLPRHSEGREELQVHLTEIFRLCLTDPLGPQVLLLTQRFTFVVGCVGRLQPALSEMTGGFGGHSSKISQSEPSKNAGGKKKKIRIVTVTRTQNK